MSRVSFDLLPSSGKVGHSRIVRRRYMQAVSMNCIRYTADEIHTLRDRETRRFLFRLGILNRRPPCFYLVNNINKTNANRISVRITNMTRDALSHVIRNNLVVPERRPLAKFRRQFSRHASQPPSPPQDQRKLNQF